MEIKGSGKQLLIFLQILGAKSTSVHPSMQAIVPEGVHHHWSHWMYA